MNIREDDLSGAATRSLLALHLAGMHENSPADAVFALDLSGLRAPEVTVWTAWDGEALAGVGALKALPDRVGEVKSMRTHPDHLRRGVAAALLAHIVAVAEARGMVRLSLETGSSPGFDPALAFYRAHGFVEGEPFADYRANAFSRFFHRPLPAPGR